MLKAISTIGNFGNVTLTSTDAGAGAGPLLDLYRNSASPAASDTIGEIEFNGQDSAGNKQQYAVIHASILSPTSTAETGQIHFETATGGASTEKMIIGTSNLVINDIGAVFNVRIEGDTDANLFYTDATNSRVGVGTISPAQKLDVVGAIKSSDNVIQGTAGKGVNFTANTPAAGMTSQLLNWYEEGTWVVTVTPETSGTITLNSSFDSASYTRIGNNVSVRAQLQISGSSLPVGTFIKISLPFAIASLPEISGRFGTTVNVDFGGSQQILFALGVSGDTFISAYVTASTATSPRNIWFSFSYAT